MGHPQTAETRAKISVAIKKAWEIPEVRAKWTAAPMGNRNRRGKRSPEETRARISASCWKGGKIVSARKSKAKRRALGFNPLNSPFVGCNGHHINLDDVIYIPEAMHASVRHNVWTGKGMEEINVLAGRYLTEDWT